MQLNAVRHPTDPSFHPYTDWHLFAQSGVGLWTAMCHCQALAKRLGLGHHGSHYERATPTPGLHDSHPRTTSLKQ